MLLTLISTLLGILSSTIPNLIRIWERRNEAKYEIELTKLRLEAAREGLQMSREVEEIKAIVQEGDSLRDNDSSINASPFINDLRASVRPIITYTFFFLYIAVKAVAFAVIIGQGITVQNMELALNTIFDDNAIAIFSAVLGYWFGSRAMEKFSNTPSKQIVLINSDGTKTIQK